MQLKFNPKGFPSGHGCFGAYLFNKRCRSQCVEEPRQFCRRTHGAVLRCKEPKRWCGRLRALHEFSQRGWKWCCCTGQGCVISRFSPSFRKIWIGLRRTPFAKFPIVLWDALFTKRASSRTTVVRAKNGRRASSHSRTNTCFCRCSVSWACVAGPRGHPGIPCTSTQWKK